MRIVRHVDTISTADRGAVLAIGNFDGVHRGHQAVFRSAIAQARSHNAPAGALLFDPHPRQFFQPDVPFFTITPMPLRLELLEDIGLDLAVVLPFEQGMASLSAEDFVDKILVKGLGVSHVIVGYDFNYGHGRRGSAASLARAGDSRGFGVTIVEAVTSGAGQPVYASSTIRKLLQAGDMAAAAGQLGRSWRVRGVVTSGAKRGTGLGFPTANIDLADGQGFKHGIYAARVWHNGRSHDAASYLGTRPMFDNGRPVLETFLLDFDGDLYGLTIDIDLIEFLRGDSAFTSIEALKVQMQADCDAARKILAGHTPAA